MHRESFERFYYQKVALGEGCGCAEHVTRMRDLDAIGERLASGRKAQGMLSIVGSWLEQTARRIRREADPQA